jgi:hypothetical protein
MQPPRRGRGQPPFEPTPAQRTNVQVMRADGDSLDTICRSIGCSEKTLRKHFKTELATGHAQVVAAVGGAVVRAALNGNMHTAKFWLSCHGGERWRVIERREIGGLEGAPPIAVEATGVVTVYLPDNGRDREPTDQRAGPRRGLR